MALVVVLFWFLILILVLVPFLQPAIKPPCAASVGEKGRAIEDVLRRATDIVTLGKNMKQFCLYCII